MTDKAIKLFRDGCSILGLGTICYGLYRSTMYLVNNYSGILADVFCTIVGIIFGYIFIKMIWDETKIQFRQRHNLKHEKLLTFHNK